jgi:anaerobic selenocysteine-containing dehydrogenase
VDDKRKPKIEPHPGPAGGWGSVKSVKAILQREHVPIPSTVRELWRQNKPGGFTCVSCAWPHPAKPAKFEFCENGAKASAWELTSLRTTPEFFAQHTCTELRAWSDHDLEQQGRLTDPMRYDRATDKYVRCEWDEAFTAIGNELKRLDPKSVVFYASGRASLETSYLYALFARLYGNNNLPDSSNMCHEATGVALRKSVGSAVGTVVLTTSRKPTASCSSARTPASTVRACCTTCRRRLGAACRSSCSTRCASADWNASPIRRARSNCWRGRKPRSRRSTTR